MGPWQVYDVELQDTLKFEKAASLCLIHFSTRKLKMECSGKSRERSEGKWVVQDVNICANPSAEVEDEDGGVDYQAVKVIDIVDTFRNNLLFRHLHKAIH